jgi:hypothetical protein
VIAGFGKSIDGKAEALSKCQDSIFYICFSLDKALDPKLLSAV